MQYGNACRMLDIRQGKPSEAVVRTGSTRVVLRMPSNVPNTQTERPIEAASAHNDAKRLAEEMSRSLWSSLNPGYMQQDPGSLRSVASADYAWNVQEVGALTLLAAKALCKQAPCSQRAVVCRRLRKRQQPFPARGRRGVALR